MATRHRVRQWFGYSCGQGHPHVDRVSPRACGRPVEAAPTHERTEHDDGPDETPIIPPPWQL